jgi:hypothetical protein
MEFSRLGRERRIGDIGCWLRERWVFHVGAAGSQINGCIMVRVVLVKELGGVVQSSNAAGVAYCSLEFALNRCRRLWDIGRRYCLKRLLPLAS